MATTREALCRVWTKKDRDTMVAKWERTISIDGRKAKGYTIKAVWKSREVYDIFLVYPKK